MYGSSMVSVYKLRCGNTEFQVVIRQYITGSTIDVRGIGSLIDGIDRRNRYFAAEALCVIITVSRLVFYGYRQLIVRVRCNRSRHCSLITRSTGYCYRKVLFRQSILHIIHYLYALLFILRPCFIHPTCICWRRLISTRLYFWNQQIKYHIINSAYRSSISRKSNSSLLVIYTYKQSVALLPCIIHTP